MTWTCYLSGEVHTDWRDAIVNGARDRDLPIEFTSAVTDHGASDAAGDGLPPSSEGFWRDHKSAKVNAIRTRTLIAQCDVAVVRFGEKYRQWNAAFDAGALATLGKPYITLHDDELVHALKEVDAAALAWATTTDQVLDVLEHVTGSAKP
ncbi:MAG: YtoQ family protein [Planctomycetota bacterium]